VGYREIIKKVGRKIWKKIKKLIFRIDDSCNNMYWKIERGNRMCIKEER